MCTRALVVDGTPELRRAAYDARAAGEWLPSAGWPDRDSTGAALVDPIAPGVIADLFEARATG